MASKIYRVNCGNCQVGNTNTLAACIQEMRAQREFDRRTGQTSYDYIEKMDTDTGEWFRYNISEKRADKVLCNARHSR